VQKLSTPSHPNSSKYLTTPSKHYGIEVFPYQDHGEEVEEKTKSSRENKKLKRRQGVEVKRRRSIEESPSQEDESVRPQDLEYIHPTSQPKPKISLKLVF
jgi:hypothetical protein